MTRPRPIPEILADLAPDRLRAILADLAARIPEVADRLQLLGAPPADRAKSLRRTIAGLKRRRAFVHYRESFELARELETLVAAITDAGLPPRDTLDLAAAFLGTVDSTVLRADDSAGVIGSVYSQDGVQAFAAAAAQADDPTAVIDHVLAILDHDANQVCWTLLELAPTFLDRDAMVALGEHLDARDAKLVPLEGRHFRPYREAAKILARGLGDADRFAALCRASGGDRSWMDSLDLARLYLAAGRTDEALSALQGVERHRLAERKLDAVLLDVLAARGETAAATDVAWRIFRRERSDAALGRLLDLVGEDEREAVIAGEVAAIEAQPALEPAHVKFLEQHRDLAAVARHVEARAARLDGRQYDWLPTLAASLADGGELRAATLVYRALLLSILERAQTRTYGHGARYLKRLDALAPLVADWGAVADHEAFVAEIRGAHGRKTSFWGRYGEG